MTGNRKIHKSEIDLPYLKEEDKCFYYLDYTAGTYSESQSMVSNYKKEIDKKDLPEWYYRNKAISDFASMIHKTLKSRECTIVPCPTSKPRNHKDFNDRLDLTAKELGALSKNYNIVICLDTITAHTPIHYKGSNSKRDPNSIKENTKFIGSVEIKNKSIILIDDMLTTGAHFRAYKDILLEHYPSLNIIGIFLAKNIREMPFEVISF